MKGNKNKLAILFMLICVSIGILGLWGFYHQNTLVLNTCGLLCGIQLLIAIFKKQIKISVIPYLLACGLLGFGLTRSYDLFLPYSLCLYYTTGFIYMILLMFIPFSIICVLFGIAGIILYYLNVDLWFGVCGLFCFTNFFIACMRGKTVGSAYRLWFCLFIIGLIGARIIPFLSGIPYTAKIIIGLLWGSCAFYPISAIYVWYRMRTSKEDLTKPGSFD